MTRRSHRNPSLLPGFVAGIAAWIVGYVLTYLVVAPDVRESNLNRFVETFDGEPATAELVGWVFFNAHFVDVVVRGLPVLGGGTMSFVGGDGGFTPLLYLVPALVLFLAGTVLVRFVGVADEAGGALTAATLVPGYLLSSVVCAVGFEVTTAGASAAPDLVSAVAIAGVAYPVVFGAAGSVLATLAVPEQPAPA